MKTTRESPGAPRGRRPSGLRSGELLAIGLCALGLALHADAFDAEKQPVWAKSGTTGAKADGARKLKARPRSPSPSMPEPRARLAAGTS